MRIDFESSGGFANIQVSSHLNTDTLPKDQAAELLRLVESSGVFNLQPSDLTPAGAGGPPDVFHYVLSLSDGGRQKELAVTDVTAPAPLRPLLAYLRKLALEQRQKGNNS